MKIAGVILPPVMADAVRSCRPHFVAAAAFSFFMNLLFLAPAIYMLQVYDRVVASGGKTTLLFITIALAIALLTMSALDAIRSRLLVKASLRLDSELAPKILDRMMTTGSPGAMQAMRDFDNIRQTVGSPIIAALFDVPWFPIFLIVAFLLHFWLGVLALLAAVVLLFVAWRNQVATNEGMQRATQAMSFSQQAAQTVALNSDVVRALGMTGAMVDRQLAHRQAALNEFAGAHFAGSRYAATSRFLRLFVQSASLGLGALLAIAGHISAGAIIAASIIISRALQPVDALIGGWTNLLGARASLARLADVMAGMPPERIYTQLPQPEGRLDVEQVGVRGPDGNAIIFGVTFKVRPGELLGIVGPSGAGKTTLAKAIAGAIPADVGTIRVDGAKLSDWDHDALARHIGFLPQEGTLFEGTVKENISRFDGSVGPEIDEAVVKAAQSAGVHELILKLPKGYDTRLGPLGHGLSAGQAQRVALARALYGDPAILILDEPNAFLDSDGEEALVNSINKALKRKAAVILIAHRRAVLKNATHLLVLESGRQMLNGPANEVAARLAAPPAQARA